MAIVYQHRRKDTYEIFYIGIGKSINRAYTYGRNDIWNKIVDKYGYEVDILIDGCTWEDACEIEKGLIQSYGRIDLGTGQLANMTDGGEGLINYIFSEDHKQKLKGPKTEEHKIKIGLASKGRNIGRKHTKEAKKKMSIASKGRSIGKKHTEEAKKKMSEKAKGRVSANKGKAMSEEQKKKISETLKNNPIRFWLGKNRDKETNKKISETLKNKNKKHGNKIKNCS